MPRTWDYKQNTSILLYLFTWIYPTFLLLFYFYLYNINIIDIVRKFKDDWMPKIQIEEYILKNIARYAMSLLTIVYNDNSVIIFFNELLKTHTITILYIHNTQYKTFLFKTLSIYSLLKLHIHLPVYLSVYVLVCLSLILYYFQLTLTWLYQKWILRLYTIHLTTYGRPTMCLA